MSLPNIPIDGIVSGYTQVFNWLHSATSRQVVVLVSPIQSGCLNHSGYDAIERKARPIYNSGNPFSQTTPTVISSLGISGILNIPFSGGNSCPVCNGDGFLYSPTSGAVNARIQWRNQETAVTFERIKMEFGNADVRLKITGATDKDLMDRAIKVHIDSYICEKTKEAVPEGLRDVFQYKYYLRKVQ